MIRRKYLVVAAALVAAFATISLTAEKSSAGFQHSGTGTVTLTILVPEASLDSPASTTQFPPATTEPDAVNSGEDLEVTPQPEPTPEPTSTVSPPATTDETDVTEPEEEVPADGVEPVQP